MGCKSVSSKKPIVAESINAPSEGRVKNHVAPAALPVDIKVIAKYGTEIIFEQNFKEYEYVKNVINDINKKLTGENYFYKIQGKDLLINGEDKLSAFLSKMSDKSSNKSNKDINTLLIDVALVGLPNLAPSPLKEFYSYNYIAKPLTDPFEIAIFDKNTGKIEIESLSSQLEDANMMIYSELSAYCSGMDHLYISGGEDVNATSLWDIDLSNKTIYKSKFCLKCPRKLHSMIFIPNNYVFIVGGLETKEVEYYDISNKEIFTHSELNEERIEPALIIINDTFLYSFTGYYTHKGKLLDSFERINLKGDSKKWELISPKFENLLENSMNSAFTQKFFAVSMHTPGSVIFLGGIHGASFESNDNFCHIYDYDRNILSLSSIPHITSDFGEKFFYPLDSYNNILIPYLNRDEVSIVRYTTDEGIKKITFEFDSDLRISLSIYRQNEFRLLVDDELMSKRDIFKPRELISKNRIAHSYFKDDNGAVNPIPIDDNIKVEKPLPNSVINFNENVEKKMSRYEVNETDDGKKFWNSEFNDVKGEVIENFRNDQQRDLSENVNKYQVIEVNKGDFNKVLEEEKHQNGKVFTNDGNDILKYKYNLANYVNNILHNQINIEHKMGAADVTPNPHCHNSNSVIRTHQ